MVAVGNAGVAGAPAAPGSGPRAGGPARQLQIARRTAAARLRYAGDLLPRLAARREQQRFAVINSAIKLPVIAGERYPGILVLAGDFVHFRGAGHPKPGSQQMIQRLLCLAQPPAQRHRQRALFQPPGHHPHCRGHGFLLRREYIIGMAVGAFNNQRIARHNGQGFVDRRRLDAQVAGVEQPFSGRPARYQRLGRAEAVSRRVERKRVLRRLQRFPVFQGDGLGTTQVIVQQPARPVGQHRPAVAGDMVGMGVGNCRRFLLAERVQPQIQFRQINPPVKNHFHRHNAPAAGCGGGHYSIALRAALPARA